MCVTNHNNELISPPSSKVDISITHSGLNFAGENLTLECSVSGTNVLAAFQWSDGRGDLENNTDTRDMISTSATATASSLHFTPLQESHEGTYNCCVIIGGAKESKSVNVSVNGMFV